jgi:hypothetical protein
LRLDVPSSGRILKTIHIRDAIRDFGPFYKGPGRWLLIGIWALCIPAALSLAYASVLYLVFGVASLLSSTSITIGDSCLLPLAFLWWFAIPCARVATVALTLPFALKPMPNKAMWGGLIAVAANWIAFILTLLVAARLRF